MFTQLVDRARVERIAGDIRALMQLVDVFAEASPKPPLRGPARPPPARGRTACPSRARRGGCVTPASTVGGLGREQGVVDADAVVPLPGAGLVVPEGVAARRAVGLPGRRRSGPGTSAPGRRRGSRGWKRASPTQRPGLSASSRLGDDVVVAGQHQRLLQRQQLAGVARSAAPSSASL